MLRLRLEPREGDAFHHDLDGESVVLGRSSRADVVIADRFLSRQHARLVRRDGSWFLEDLGSRNTTFLNERPVLQPEPIRPGDVIRLAESRVVVEDPRAGPSGDGLAGGELPGHAILREATLLLAPDRTAAEPSRALSRLRVLNEVHRALAAPISLPALLDLVLDSAFAHLAPEQGAVFLRRPDGSFERAASRRGAGVRGDLVFSRRLAQEVTDKGVAALVTDVGADRRFAASESLLESRVRSLIAAPLLDHEGCLGMVALHRLSAFSEEDLELLAALAAAAAMRIRNIALAEETARRRLLDRELELAHDIQVALVPRVFPSPAGADVAGALRPARSVGGDLYDVVAEDGRLWLLIGDVSGKGIGAALFMAVTRTLFRAIAPGAPSVAAAVARVNDELARDNERAMFVTAFAARLDLATGAVEFVNAGHHPPYRLTPAGAVEPVSGRVEPALGAVEGHAYSAGSLRLIPGDALLLYTDGVVEARSGKEEEFGEGRLGEYLAACGEEPAAAIVDGLVERVFSFAGDEPQYDDVTVLAVRYRGGEADGSATPDPTPAVVLK
jgi:serine phosphatase RsbU (regulator of sigma subunit)